MSRAKPQRAYSAFETKLREAVMQYSMLKHPFYVAWSEGKLSKDVLREYAKQYYAHVRAFPTYVIIDHEGILRFQSTGYGSANLDAAVKKQLKAARSVAAR